MTSRTIMPTFHVDTCMFHGAATRQCPFQVFWLIVPLFSDNLDRYLWEMGCILE
jgi:hypothetical protein